MDVEISTQGDDGAVKCLWAFNALFGCPTPANQFQAYYRNGEFETCGDKFKDLRICLWAKLQHDRTKAKEILAEASYMQQHASSEDILKRKETPGW